jgi:signal transduction histidine kinase
VDGAVWGTIRVESAEGRRDGAGAAERLAGFCELAATGVANLEARERLRRLADEQRALRRVAMLVAERAPAERLVACVDEEAGRLLGGAQVTIEPRAPDGSAEAEAEVLVDGAVWGRITARPGGPGAAELLARFGELVASAIANARAREEVQALLAEQAALRRVATMVAEGASSSRLFSAVTDEVARLLEVPIVTLDRFDGDAATTVLAATHAGVPVTYPVGSRWPLDGPSVAASIRGSGRSARIDDYSGLAGTTAGVHRRDPRVSSFGVPITVDGRLWGMIGVGSTPALPLPAETEARLTRFTELVATAVSNATARAELIASRTRLVVAGDDARRRIERTLHDGPRVRLAGLVEELEALRSTVPPAEAELAESLARVERDIGSVLAQLGELTSGLHPALLARHGIARSIEELAARCPIPVELELSLAERPPEPVEIGVYYVVSEALTNAAKHSRASRVRVSLAADPERFAAAIADDGVGGAEPGRGSGLSGLADRVVALGGRFALDSPAGGGTRIAVEFPRD